MFVHNHDIYVREQAKTYFCEILCDVVVYIGAVWLAVWFLIKLATI